MMNNTRTFLAKLIGYIAICSWLTLILFVFLYIVLEKLLTSLEILNIAIIMAVIVTVMKIRIN